VTWFYALGSIVRLFQNRYFLRAVEEWRFAKNVNRIAGPFYIVCGFGDTGSVLVRGMNEAGYRKHEKYLNTEPRHLTQGLE
jgi:hypothetical protein